MVLASGIPGTAWRRLKSAPLGEMAGLAAFAAIGVAHHLLEGAQQPIHEHCDLEKGSTRRPEAMSDLTTALRPITTTVVVFLMSLTTTVGF
jgi:hypothetical protein